MALASLGAMAGPAALAQDAAGPGQPDAAATQPQSSTTQRIEGVGRQGANDLRRAASVAKQIYGR